MVATLLSQASGASLRLVARTRVGRAKDNELLLDSPWVSALHSCLQWSEPGCWELRDLGSRNGTFINGSRLGEGERRVLRAGGSIAFGDPGSTWLLEDDGAPLAAARNIDTREWIWAQHQMLSIGSEQPQIQIYENAQGEWVGEFFGVPRPVTDGEEIVLGTQRFLLWLPRAYPPTSEGPGQAPIAELLRPIGASTLHFRVSADREHIELRVLRRGQVLLHSDRAFVAVLLQLAEARLADSRRSDISEAEHGWVYTDDLVGAMAFSDAIRLNVEIHRARTEFGRAGVPNAPTLIERRRSSGQLRLGTGAIHIEDLRVPSSRALAYGAIMGERVGG
jgi:hypothetical protein